MWFYLINDVVESNVKWKCVYDTKSAFKQCLKFEIVIIFSRDLEYNSEDV